MNNNNQDRTYKDVQILEQTTVYSGYFRMDQYKLRFRKFAGDWSTTITRELFERGDAVAVLLYDPKSEKVVLIEQFRVGAIREVKQKNSPWLTELVAGVIEKNETPEQVLFREVIEEAGITLNNSTKIIPICEYYVSPGGSSEKVSLFCALINADEADGIHGLQEEMEDIRVKVMNVNDAFHEIKTGKINNAPTIIALQWLESNQKNLKTL